MRLIAIQSDVIRCKIIKVCNLRIQLLHVVPEGKKPMDGTSFAAGLRLKAGDSL